MRISKAEYERLKQAEQVCIDFERFTMKSKCGDKFCPDCPKRKDCIANEVSMYLSWGQWAAIREER
jgi:hypothetical protein